MIPLYFLIAILLALATAHGGTSNYTVNGVWYRGYSPDTPAADQDGQPWLVGRKWITINPIFNSESPYLSCNSPGDPATSSIPIQAGENITAVYYYWLHTVGPMILWLAACGDSCSMLNLTTANWFKIAERGLLNGDIQTGEWGQREFQNWDGTPDLWTETIPRDLRSGRYVMRHEIIALHIANNPQFYPECAHLEVSGDGTAVPGQEYYVKIPGVWSMNQPEINIDVYAVNVSNLTTYKIPGPPVWKGAKRDGMERVMAGFKGP